MIYGGLDVGTSGCKLSLFDAKGFLLQRFEAGYSEQRQSGQREINPLDVQNGIHGILEQAAALNEPIAAIAVAGIGESIVCVDSSGRPLHNIIVTGDVRGIEEVKILTERYAPQKIFELTGLPPNELYGLPKYLWLNKHTDAIKKADKIFFVEDFAAWYLTGQRKVSYSSAARSLMFNIETKDWIPEFLQLAGIHREQLSRPCMSGSLIGPLRPELRAEFPSLSKTQIVVGGHDQTTAAIGSGLIELHSAEVGLGSCGFMFMPLQHKVTSKHMLEKDFTCTPYVFPDSYLTSAEITTYGVLINWMREHLSYDAAVETDFFAEIEKRIHGKRTNVLILPQFGSSGTPQMSMDAIGTITGLTLDTRAEDIYLGLLESFAFQFRLANETLDIPEVSIGEITATGGGSQSAAQLQILANVFNLPIYVPEQYQSGTLGCMILASVGAGEYPDIKTAIRSCVRRTPAAKPQVETRAYYEKKYAQFKDLYKKMSLFNNHR